MLPFKNTAPRASSSRFVNGDVHWAEIGDPDSVERRLAWSEAACIMLLAIQSRVDHSRPPTSDDKVSSSQLIYSPFGLRVEASFMDVGDDEPRQFLIVRQIDGMLGILGHFGMFQPSSDLQQTI